MEDKLFRELYNFVDDVNTLLSNLSAENVEMAGNAGVIDAIDVLYNIVERQGMANRENS